MSETIVAPAHEDDARLSGRSVSGKEVGEVSVKRDADAQIDERPSDMLQCSRIAWAGAQKNIDCQNRSFRRPS
jgi:hypothetical protein